MSSQTASIKIAPHLAMGSVDSAKLYPSDSLAEVEVKIRMLGIAVADPEE
jgi:hypothetical protein